MYLGNAHHQPKVFLHAPCSPGAPCVHPKQQARRAAYRLAPAAPCLPHFCCFCPCRAVRLPMHGVLRKQPRRLGQLELHDRGQRPLPHRQRLQLPVDQQQRVRAAVLVTAAVVLLRHPRAQQLAAQHTGARRPSLHAHASQHCNVQPAPLHCTCSQHRGVLTLWRVTATCRPTACACSVTAASMGYRCCPLQTLRAPCTQAIASPILVMLQP